MTDRFEILRTRAGFITDVIIRDESWKHNGVSFRVLMEKDPSYVEFVFENGNLPEEVRNFVEDLLLDPPL